ncbi:MAG: hypothetical protein JXL97_15165 [Bacteroidales bacterium]|nr:hypothetical protein [Bacteroidales bacterium]
MKKKYIISFFLILTLFGFKSNIKNNFFNDKLTDKILYTLHNYEDLMMNCDKNPELMHSWITDAGIRSKYYCIKSVLDFKLLEKLTGAPVFVKGPHSDTLNYFSLKQFGYYNPNFLNVISTTIDNLSENEIFMSLGKKIYEDHFIEMARNFYMSYMYVNSDKKLKKLIVKNYKKKMKTAKPGDYENDPSFYLIGQFEGYAISHEEEFDFYESLTASGFWIRRSIDRTETQFFEILSKTMNLFDKEFLNEN